MSVVTGFRVAASFAVVSAGALVMLALAVPTLFRARRLYSEVIGSEIGRAVLAIWGIRIRVHEHAPRPARQVVYISNHPSTLDVFSLIALALPRTRFFLAGYLRRIPPIAIIGYLIRIFWTVTQDHPDVRRQIFARADRVLRQTGDSVYLSPEGMRVATGEIGAFNKGAFHLATSLRAPIVPIYFHIPRDVDPGRGFAAGAGTVDVHFLPPVDTDHWSLDTVPASRDSVRDLYLRVHASMRATGSMPADLTVHRPVDAPVLAGAGA